MLGKRSLTVAERQRRHRARVKERRGKRIYVDLGAEAAAALAVLVRARGGTQAMAVEDAILALAKAEPVARVTVAGGDESE